MKSKRPYSAQDVSKIISNRSEEMYLLESSYVDYKTKCTFVDIVHGQWECTPGNVVNKQYSHPNRKKEKTKATFIKNYGVDHPMKNTSMIDRVKATMVEKYGVDNPMKSTEIRSRALATNLEKYGFENPTQNKDVAAKVKATNNIRFGGNAPACSPDIVEKTKKTNLLRYGVTAPAKNSDVQLKMIETYHKIYGFSNPAKSPTVKQKTLETNLNKYNRPYTVLDENNLPYSIKYLDKEGNSIKSVCEDKKVNYDMASKVFAKHGQDFCLDWIDGYVKNITDIELLLKNKMDWVKFDKKISNAIPYRPDFKVNETTYVEADGLYWHSEACRDNSYHFNKRVCFEANGARIFQFHSVEILNKIDIVSSIVDNYLNKSCRKFSARKCTISEIDHAEASVFLNNNHLMGAIKARHIGLLIDGELISLMSYKIKDSVLKIDRFCSLLNSTVRGGFSKLLKYLENTERPIEIHNWVDLRYGTGKHLESKGFVFKKDVQSWKWTDNIKTFNRLHCTANMDERRLSEKEHAKEMGLTRIYDAGQRLYIKYPKLVDNISQNEDNND